MEGKELFVAFGATGADAEVRGVAFIGSVPGLAVVARPGKNNLLDHRDRRGGDSSHVSHNQRDMGHPALRLPLL